jgi:hypothetical protein
MNNKITKVPLYSKDNFMFENNNLPNTIRANGRSKHPEDVNVLEMFLQEYKVQPKLFRIVADENGYFNWDLLRTKFKKLFPDCKMLFSDTFYDINKEMEYNKQETWKLRDGLMIQMEGGNSQDFYLVNCNLEDVSTLSSYNLFLVKEEFPELKEIIKIFKQCQIERIETISIGMVSFDDGNFFVKDFDLKGKTTELRFLDEHYGDGFIEFNDKLLKRLAEETKGLTLFHGAPGSGKTTFIRHLLKKLKEMNKDNNILYFPPTMVGSITDPNFINFISEWVTDSKGKNYLLIEDAEPLLESRDSTRNIGITNLLNLTDGLLNDILNIQIIATFNTNLSNIDTALLRPERLMARKEFEALTIEKGKHLASLIDINPDLITKKMTLADIYALKNERKPITHNISNKINDGKVRGFNNRD